MKPQKLGNSPDLFRSQVSQIINMNHRLNWERLEPDVECIAKGKVYKRYEFGNKASVTTILSSNWIVGMQGLQGNPYDGHTLGNAIEYINQLVGRSPKHTYYDAGYRGHGYEGESTVRVVRKLPKRAATAQRRWLKRRASIEPIIVHMKQDHRMARNYLKESMATKRMRPWRRLDTIWLSF